MAEHLRGQDTLVSILKDGETIAEFSVQSLTVSPQQNIDNTRYLGAIADSYEETFEGYTGEVSGHATGDGAARGISQFFESAILRAQRKRSFVANIATTHAYPGGDRVRYIYSDVRIGSPSISSSGNDRVEFSFSFATGERRRF